MTQQVRFFVNGKERAIDNPDPTELLVNWLRSPDVGLTGTKKGCAQGGCGACTVMLSRWDDTTGRVVHEAINACLRPVCSVDGMAITTVEGAGSVETELNPVQYRIAKDNGSQCGYCTPGWVMTMTAFLAANPGRKATQREIEDMFDGNLCRCTGYRPILYAMRHFASDWTPEDEIGSMDCLVDPNVKHTSEIMAPTPPRSAAHAPLLIEKDGYTWFRAPTLEAVLDLLQDRDPDQIKLVNGNTSIGIYDRYQEHPKHLIDISGLNDLKYCSAGPASIVLGAGITYSEALTFLDRTLAGGADTGLAALRYMAQRTAGTIVRNAASLGGNTMLVVRHMLHGAPFPSDAFTAFAMLDAKVIVAAEGHRPRQMPILAFTEDWQRKDSPLRRAVILGYEVPRARPRAFAQTYKTALREVNAHAIVNAGCRVLFDAAGLVTEAHLVFGGIAPIAFHAKHAERALIGKPWTGGTLKVALVELRHDVDAELARWRERLSTVPDEGFTDEYRRHLAESYLYQFFVEVASATGSTPIPASIASAGQRTERPVSRGTQSIPKNADPAPVGLPFVKLDAFLQATGEAHYTHDLPLPPRGVNGAFVLSRKAVGRFEFRIPGEGKTDAKGLEDWLRVRFPGVVGLLTAADIPVARNNRTIRIAEMPGGVDPLLADGRVEWYGQPIALVMAENEIYAMDVANHVREHCVAYDEPLAPPILTFEQAIAANSQFVDTTVAPYNHIVYVERPDSDLGWAGKSGSVILDNTTCLIVNGMQETGSQAHYYMETQSTLAVPGEWGQMDIHPSSQSPDTVQSTVASVLGVPLSRVGVTIRRVGGGYGGKTTRSPYVAGPAAAAAAKFKRPVRIAVRREEDMEMIGRRHPFRGRYSLAVAAEGAQKGRILGLSMELLSGGGATYDCSFTVMDCVQMRIDSAYMVPNWKTEGQVARTNLASNTAFRSMGLIQAVVILEDGIAKAAHALGMRAEDLRLLNMYKPGDQTIVGTTLTVCYMRQVWGYMLKKADFERRSKAVDAFNAANRWRKRGIAAIPVQYGAGYNASFLEQAGALVDVYDQDGSVLVHQGGVEIGQGLQTKIAQVAAETLNVPMSIISMAETNLGVVPNPVSTGASTGTGFNAEAVRTACTELRKRLEEYCLGLLVKNGAQWCVDNHVDFWNHKTGWNTEYAPGKSMWQAIVGSAHFNRVNLSAQVRVRIPGGTAPAENIYPNSGPTAEKGVDQFTGYTFSAGCTEVEIDVLTGETTVLRADLIYDIGDSLNPAVDIGQVEGAYVQGMGYILTEEIVTQPDGQLAGRLNSNNTWGYKLPATTTIPLAFNVGFFPRAELGLPSKHDLVLGSKEVGEPPLVLAGSVYLAVKNAVLAARQDRGHDAWFEMPAPATVQRVREACLVEMADLVV